MGIVIILLFLILLCVLPGWALGFIILMAVLWFMCWVLGGTLNALDTAWRGIAEWAEAKWPRAFRDLW